MARRIYKYGPIRPSLDEYTKIWIPQWFDIVHFGEQDGLLYFWAEVDTDEPTVEHEFIVIGTGWDLPEDAFLNFGTCQVGAYVWHLYERYVEDETLRSSGW